MDNSQNLLTTKGIGVNVSVDNSTVIILVAGIFLAVLLGVTVSTIITKNI